MGLAGRAIRSVAGAGVVNVVKYGLGFIVQIGFARLLTPELFGAVALGSSILTFFMIFGQWGVSEAIVSDVDHEAVFSTIVWLRVAYAILMVAVILVASIGLRWFYDGLVVDTLLILSIGTAVKLVSGPFIAVLERDLYLSGIEIVRLTSLIAGSGVGLWLTLNGYGVWGLIVFYFLKDAVSSVLFFILATDSPTFAFSMATARWFFNFAKGMVSAKALMVAETKGDDLIIGTLGGSAVLGVYSVAWRLAQAFRSVSQPVLNMGIIPTFANVSESTDRKRGMEFITRLQLHIAIPGYACAGLLAPELIRLTFGRDWLSTVPVFQALTVAAILFPLLGSMRTYYFSQTDTDSVLNIQITYITCLVVGLGTLIPLYGSVGAAIAVDITLAVAVGLVLYYLRRDIGFDLRGVLGPATIAGIVAVLAGSYVRFYSGVGTGPLAQTVIVTVLAVVVGFYLPLIAVDRARLLREGRLLKQALQTR